MRYLFVILCLVFGACSEMDTPPKRVPTNTISYGGMSGGWIYEYRRDSITYLVFQRGEGLFVVNYTQDSLEYEFLKHPTK